MPKLDRATREELVDLLAPLMVGEADCRALLSLAFGEHPNLLYQIETVGPVQTFVLNLIVKLVDYGDIERGKPALWALLEAAREGMGVDHQARVDALRPAFGQPEPSETATAAARSSEVPKSPETTPSVASVLALFEQLNPRDQLGKIMLWLGMPAVHQPAPALRLDEREVKVVEWAARREGGLAQLAGILRALAEQDVAQSPPEPEGPGPSGATTMEPPVDFVIVTPLAEERDAVLEQLGDCPRIPPTEQDIRVYYGTDLPVRFPGDAQDSYRIVVMPLLGMGRVEAANATADAIRRWQPRYVLLVGIAGGLAKAEVGLGDVLIADQVADYEQQKRRPDETEIRWQVHRTDARLLGEAQNLARNVWQQRIGAERPDANKPTVHVGPICTGDKVIADESLAKSYQEIWAKLIGVEMEAGGAASAAFQAPSNPGFFMIRGVSDLADAKKDSKKVRAWRGYACDVAAAFTVALLENGAVPVRPR